MEIRMQSPVGAHINFSGRDLLYFSGTGYLGLQSHPQVLQAALDALLRYGLSTATSRGGYGEHPIYDELETQARAFWGCERVLYLASGYLGPAVLAQGLRGSYEVIFIDEFSHYSIFDGARSTQKPIHTFRHRDPQHLAQQCRLHLKAGQRPLVLSDGVFPISGEIAPVPDYLQVIEPLDGLIALDDAHAAGVLGENGRGTLEYFHLNHPRCLSSCTLSKGLGGYGGIVAGSAEIIGVLEQNSRIPAGTSPTPLPAAAASAAALRLARTQPELRQQLWRNVAHARQGLRQLGWPLEDTPVPVLCLRARVGLDLAALKQSLFDRGLAVAHVTSYSSTPHGGCLRVAVFASHTSQEIDTLLSEIGSLV